MGEVDFAKLSEQYAGFLVAAGGVSITVLTLVLGLSFESKNPPAKEKSARLFLVTALIVATVSCFVGAHMLAETAAFFAELNGEMESSAGSPLGRRMFVLATAHIFISVALILFAILLLPTATGRIDLAAGIDAISQVAFPAILIAALGWMILAARDRSPVGESSWWVIAVAILIGLSGIFSCYLPAESLAQGIFTFIVAFTAISLLYFAYIFKTGQVLPPGLELGAFISAITLSYAGLGVAYFKILRDFKLKRKRKPSSRRG